MKSFFAFMFLAALTICAASVTGYSQDIKDAADNNRLLVRGYRGVLR